MSKVLFEGPCAVYEGTQYLTKIEPAAIGGLLVTQEGLDNDTFDHVILSDAACEAIAKYIEGEE